MKNSIINELSQPLKEGEINLSVKRIVRTSEGKYQALCVINKTSRAVYSRFNDVCGMDWKDEYEYDKNETLVCKLSIWDKDNQRWVTRCGAGTPGNIEKEKARYSDALKRASVAFGHGIELYKMPTLLIEFDEREVMKYNNRTQINPSVTDLKTWKIKYDYDNEIVSNLEIRDKKGELRWAS